MFNNNSGAERLSDKRTYSLRALMVGVLLGVASSIGFMGYLQAILSQPTHPIKPAGVTVHYQLYGAPQSALDSTPPPFSPPLIDAQKQDQTQAPAVEPTNSVDPNTPKDSLLPPPSAVKRTTITTHKNKVVKAQKLSATELAHKTTIAPPNYDNTKTTTPSVFNPVLRAKLANKTASTPAKKIDFVETLQLNYSNANQLIKVGNHCFNVYRESVSSTVAQWSLPVPCPSSQSESTTIINNIKEAMQLRFGKAQ